MSAQLVLLQKLAPGLRRPHAAGGGIPAAAAAAVMRRALQTASWTLPATPGGTLVARLPCVCAVVVRAQDPHAPAGPHGWDHARVTLRAEPAAAVAQRPDNKAKPGEEEGDEKEEEGGRRTQDQKQQVASGQAQRDTLVADAAALRAAADALALTVRAATDDDDMQEQQKHLDSATATTSPSPREIRIEARPESTPSAVARFVHAARAWLGGPFRPPPTRFDTKVILELCLPGRFNLDLELQDGSIDIRDAFEGDLRIVTDSAAVDIHRLKGMYIDVDSGAGDVSAVVLQGHVTVRSTDGNIDIAKAQGPSVKIATRDGDIQARALYADYTSVRSASGNVRLGGAQGNTNIRTGEGHVEVAGVEGRLQIETDAGDVEAQLSVPTSVALRSRTGDIALTLPPHLRAKVLLQAAGQVDLDDPDLHLDDLVRSTPQQRTPRAKHHAPPSPAVSPEPASSKDAASVQWSDTVTAKGWIGPLHPEIIPSEMTGVSPIPPAKDPITILARAPSGEISVRAGSWIGLTPPSLIHALPTTAKWLQRFPRWASAFPPPSEDDNRVSTRASAS